MEAKEIYESKINEVNNLQLYSHEEMEEAMSEKRDSVIFPCVMAGICIGIIITFLTLMFLRQFYPSTFNWFITH